MKKFFLVLLFSLLPMTADAAIAYDSTCAAACGTNVASGSSISYTHNTAGANETFVIYFFHNRSSTTDVSCTVDGHDVGTARSTVNAVGTNSTLFAFVYNGASIQNPTIACSMTGGVGEEELNTGAYTGALGGFDAAGTNTAAASSLTTNVTTIADNSWAVMGGYEQGDTLTASTNATKRSANANQLTVFDSNAVVHPAGNFSMTYTSVFSDDKQAIIISISPLAAASASTFQLWPLSLF